MKSPFPVNQGFIKVDQVFRCDTDVGVQNHQNVAGRLGEAQPDRIPFASAFLYQDLDVLSYRLAATLRHSSSVLSLEWPSTKINSVCEPIIGSRSAIC